MNKLCCCCCCCCCWYLTYRKKLDYRSFSIVRLILNQSIYTVAKNCNIAVLVYHCPHIEITVLPYREELHKRSSSIVTCFCFEIFIKSWGIASLQFYHRIDVPVSRYLLLLAEMHHDSSSILTCFLYWNIYRIVRKCMIAVIAPESSYRMARNCTLQF